MTNNIFWLLSEQTVQHESDWCMLKQFRALTLSAVCEACGFAMHSMISAADNDNG